MQRRKYRYYSPHCCTELLNCSFCTIINDYITSDDVLETEDARTEYGLPKIWVKCAHVYKADTRLSSSSPTRAFLESLVNTDHILIIFIAMNRPLTYYPYCDVPVAKSCGKIIGSTWKTDTAALTAMA